VKHKFLGEVPPGSFNIHQVLFWRGWERKSGEAPPRRLRPSELRRRSREVQIRIGVCVHVYPTPLSQPQWRMALEVEGERSAVIDNARSALTSG
jgi:hypothetical protein